MAERRFRMAPGVELVPVSENRYTLRSEFDAVELTGAAAAEFAHEVLAGLGEPMGLDAILARLPGYSPASVTRQLESLVGQGLLVELPQSDSASPQLPAPPTPFEAFLEASGRNATEAGRALASTTVAVFGLEAHGAHLARLLAALGVGTIRLVDPFPFDRAHLALTPVTDEGSVGLTREVAVAAMLAAFPSGIECSRVTSLDADGVRELITGCDLAFGCWDQGFSAANQWLNRAALDARVPALFGELRATSTLAGPLYLPDRSACWMCYRMRALACAPDFEQAIAFEEHLDRTRRPRLATRGTLPILPEQLAAAMGLEAIRHLVGLHPPVLVDTVVEYDALSGSTESHPVLVVPDCPVCAKKKPRTQPPLDDLIAHAGAPTDLAAMAHRLVDRRTGVVSQFGAVSRDPSEVPIPLVWRARVANHRFIAQHDEERATCSGKGMTRSEAWASCLGEAVERYSGGCWSSEDLRFARRHELDGVALDPVDLVLYREDQYAGVPYTRYREDSELAWIRARSLVHGHVVWVPAIAALMDYPIHGPDEHLFPITSNGLAAGPTLRDAVLHGLYEVVERDALLISWLNGLAGHPHDAVSHPDDDVRRLARLYRRRGIELELIELPTDHPASAFVGIALQDDAADGPAAAVGMGADMDPVKAARKAALEVGQVRPSIRRRARDATERVAALAADPGAVASMEDHALLYSDPSAAHAFGFLFGERVPWEPGPQLDAGAALRALIAHFRDVDQDVLYVDLTPSDMGSLGVYTARVIVPGFQPIWFGRGERRLGGRRLFEFAASQGLREGPAQLDALNPMPHPIA